MKCMSQRSRLSSAGKITRSSAQPRQWHAYRSHDQSAHFATPSYLSTKNSKDWAHLRYQDNSRHNASIKVVLDEKSQSPGQYSAFFLRDSCKCPRCVDPNSTQKNFDTSQIPNNIEIESLDCQENELYIKWKNDIAGFNDHVTFVPKNLLAEQLTAATISASQHNDKGPTLWERKDAATLHRIEYKDYVEDEQTLLQAVKQLRDYGFVLIKNLPEDEKSVEKIAGRIGIIRNSFYGQTWDVKSKKAAKNVAYTKQYLGLHMDLLYMNEPPGYQLLHCLKNDASGGNALFSDSFTALLSLDEKHIRALNDLRINFKYDNDGHQYSRTASFVERLEDQQPISRKNIRVINHSPPFQGPLPLEFRNKSQDDSNAIVDAWKAFTEASESPEHLFEYRYEAGDCVIFNNRRVLHGRREFDPETGERWLKGCYVDSDVFNSRMRVLHDRLEPWNVNE